MIQLLGVVIENNPDVSVHIQKEIPHHVLCRPPMSCSNLRPHSASNSGKTKPYSRIASLSLSNFSTSSPTSSHTISNSWQTGSIAFTSTTLIPCYNSTQT